MVEINSDGTMDITAETMASVLGELDALENRPPQDEYRNSPPAYDDIHEACAHWRTAAKAHHDRMALDKDPQFVTAEKDLKDARALLQQLKSKSEEVFKASHSRRNSMGSIKLKLTLPWHKSKKSSAPTSPVDRESGGVIDAPAATVDSAGISRIISGDSAIHDEFRLAHEAEVNQESVVLDLENKIVEYKRKKKALDSVASTVTLSWVQLRRIADEKLYNTVTAEVTPELMRALEKIESAEAAYNRVKKKRTSFTRARQAVQHAHMYFSRSLGMCSLRTSLSNRLVQGALSGGFIDQSRMFEYRASAGIAQKAQICLNEVFRVLAPYEDIIPENRREDYTALKTLGLMQVTKIYNLLYGGGLTDAGTASSIKLMSERQDAAFGHLTRFAVWVQDYVPVCAAEEDAAVIARDDVRREAAALWEANINRSLTN